MPESYFSLTDKNRRVPNQTWPEPWGPQGLDLGSSSSRQRGRPREKETTCAQALTEPRRGGQSWSPAGPDLPGRGGRDRNALTTEEDKPGAAGPGNQGHGVFRCWCWMEGGIGESGQVFSFLGLFLQAFLGKMQPGDGGLALERRCLTGGWREPFWFVVSEVYRSQCRQRSLCWLLVTWSRVWACPRQSPKIFETNK